MGWTIYHTAPTNERAEIESLYTGKNVRPIYAAKRGTTWYLAAEVTGQNPDVTDYTVDAEGKYVFAAVILTQRQNGEWGYKAVDETGGPMYFDAPEKLLKLLSPTANDGANNWRKSCRATAAALASVRAIKDGDRIQTLEPLDFGNFKEDTFRAVDVKNYTRTGKTKRVYWAENARTHVRLTSANILANGFRVLA